MKEEPEIMIEDCPPQPGEAPGPDDVVIPIAIRQTNKEDRKMEVITVEQLVRETIRILGNVRIPVTVPVEVHQEIRTPIIQAISNLNACCDAWARDEENGQQEAAEGENRPETEPAEGEAENAD